MSEPAVKTIAFVAYPGLTALDLVDPLQVFSSLSRFALDFQPVVVGEIREPKMTPRTIMAHPSESYGA